MLLVFCSEDVGFSIALAKVWDVDVLLNAIDGVGLAALFGPLGWICFDGLLSHEMPNVMPPSR